MLALAAHAQTCTHQESKLVASDGLLGDFYGMGVALDGDTAVIGAPNHWANMFGTVYVQVRSGTTWSEQAMLLTSDGAAQDFFGTCVQVQGNRLAASSPQADAPLAESGAVYVFERSGTTWAQTAKLTPIVPVAASLFGNSVSLDGNQMAIGADLEGPNSQGAAYVFTYDGVNWTQQARVQASDAATADNFGWCVALRGDTLIVGSPNDDDLGSASGSVYVFTRSGTTWTQVAKLHASDGSSSANFGKSVALNASTVVVGAPRVTGGYNEQGVAYVFTGSGATWTQQAELAPSDPAANAHFGSAADIKGDVAIIGAPGDDDKGVASGSTYVYGRVGSVWSLDAKVHASDGGFACYLGTSVALDGDTVLSGAWGDSPSQANKGAAYVHRLAPDVSTYCTAKVNSAGCTPQIAFSGTPSASAASGFVISCTNEMSNKAGIFFYSKAGPHGSPFLGGYLCAAPPIVRTPVQSSGGTPPCGGSFSFDFNTYVHSGIDPALVAGVGVWTQFWCRDPGFSPPNNSNLSDAVHAVLCP